MPNGSYTYLEQTKKKRIRLIDYVYYTRIIIIIRCTHMVGARIEVNRLHRSCIKLAGIINRFDYEDLCGALL